MDNGQDTTNGLDMEKYNDKDMHKYNGQDTNTNQDINNGQDTHSNPTVNTSQRSRYNIHTKKKRATQPRGASRPPRQPFHKNGILSIGTHIQASTPNPHRLHANLLLELLPLLSLHVAHDARDDTQKERDHDHQSRACSKAGRTERPTDTRATM